jgi:hypothetical protein
MSEQTQTQRPWFFNLKADGDTAVVRLLHSKVDTIERVVSHRVTVGDKQKKVRCIGDGCPLCATNNRADDRIYLHLWDYTDNREKIWERTDKIIPQLETLQKSWAPLNSAVIRITRKGNEFPKYDIEVQNPMTYDNVDNTLVDKPLAKFYSMKRTADEIQAFLATGAFPERKEFISKEEYKKMKEAEKANSNSTPTEQNVVSNTPIVDNDPFVY